MTITRGSTVGRAKLPPVGSWSPSPGPGSALPAHGTAVRKGRPLPGLCGIAFLGAGMALASTALGLRASWGAGTGPWPPSTTAVFALALALGLLAGSVGLGARAAGLLAGLATAATAVLLLLAEWLLGPASPRGQVLAMAAPALLLGLAAALGLRAHRHRAAMLAALAFGLGLGSLVAPAVLAATGLGTGLRATAVLLLLAAPLLAVRAPLPLPAVRGRGGVLPGLLLGLAVSSLWPPLRTATVVLGGSPAHIAGTILLGAALGIAAFAGGRRRLRGDGLRHTSLLPALLLVLVWGIGLPDLAGPIAVLAAPAAFGLLLAPALLTTLGGADRRALRGILVAGLVLASAAHGWLPSPPPSAPPPTHRLVAAHGDALVRYARASQTIELWAQGQRLDAAGPDRPHGELLAHCGRLLQPEAERTALLGPGAGRAVTALREWPDAGPVDLVVHRPEAALLWTALQNFGPIPPPTLAALAAPPGMVLRALGARDFLRTARPAGIDLLLLGTPLHPAEPWPAALEFHRQARRALGPGLLLLPFRLDEVPPELLRATLCATADVHPWCGVFLVRDTGLIVAAATAPDFAATARAWDHAPRGARWGLHSAGIGHPDDLELALLGVLPFRPALQPLADDELPALASLRPTDGPAATVALLRELLGTGLSPLGQARLDLRTGTATQRTEARRLLAAERLRRPATLLLRDEEQQTSLREAREVLRALSADDPSAPAQGASIAQRFLHVGCPLPELQAALALPDRLGNPLRTEASAAAAALALDPTLGASPPPLLARILASAPARSPLEDLLAVPEPDRLARLAVGPEPLALALRVRCGSAVARALLAQLAQRRLEDTELQALRELADPFVLAEAGLALPRERRRELLALWRFDLPMPPGLAELIRGDVAERRLLSQALSGRTDPVSLGALADLMLDEEPPVRVAVAAALFRSVGDRVVYDPQWPEPRLRAAAEQVRALLRTP